MWEKKNGYTFVICNACKQASIDGQEVEIKKIRVKGENLKNHLKYCEFFCQQHKIPYITHDESLERAKAAAEVKETEKVTPSAPALPVQGKAMKAPKKSTVSTVRTTPAANPLPPNKVVVMPTIRKTITVKCSRKTEVVDICDGITVKQVVEDLKDIFNLDQNARYYLRKCNDNKILIGGCDIVSLVDDDESIKLEAAK